MTTNLKNINHCHALRKIWYETIISIASQESPQHFIKCY